MSLIRGRQVVIAALTVALSLASFAVVEHPAAAAAVAPTVTTVAPGGGRTFGGQRIAVYGSGFQRGVTVMFGNATGLFVQVASPIKLFVVTPPHRPGTVNVHVISPNGSSRTTVRDRFTYVGLPAVRDLAPRSGRISGGERIAVYGSNFRYVKAVTFDNVKGTDVRVLSSTKLLVTTPAHPAGTHGPASAVVRIVTAYGTSTAPGLGSFQYIAPPAVETITSPDGTTNGGTRVHVGGLNFYSVRSVTFGGVPATSVVEWPPIGVDVTAPPHDAGPVDVQVTTAYGSSAIHTGDGYMYVSPPLITSIAPGTAVTAGGSVVTIVGSAFSVGVSVSFGGVPSPQVSVLNDSTVHAVAPPHAAGTVDVVVTNKYGSTSVPVTYQDVTVSGVSADDANAPGITLFWANPSWPEMTGTMVRRAVGSVPPASTTDGDLVADVARWQTPTVNDAGAAPHTTYSYALFAHDGPYFAHAATITVHTRALSSLHWDAGTPVDPAAGSARALSCATPTWCMYVNQHQQARTFDGTTWSAPTAVPDANEPFALALSCPTTTFCVEADGLGGGVTVYNGSTWSTPVNLAPTSGTSAVSCSSPAFCVVIDVAGFAHTYRNGTWSAGVATGMSSATQISCVSTSFCVTVNGAGQATVFDGTTWSTPVTFGRTGVRWRISCASPTFCVAGGSDTSGGVVVPFDGTVWTAPVTVAPGAGRRVATVSCPTPTMCAAGTGDHATASFDGNAWTTATALPPAFTGSAVVVSCAAPASCVAVDTIGDAYTGDGTSWSPATLMDPLRGSPTSISCTASGFCAAVDTYGNAVTTDGAVWSAPQTVLPYGHAWSVSCASATDCVAIGAVPGSGVVATRWGGTSWTAPASLPLGTTDSVGQIACVATLCVAVGSTKNPDNTYSNLVATLSNGTWSTSNPGPGSGLSSVSCLAGPVCIAVGGAGNAWRFDGVTWTSVAAGSAWQAWPALSCASPSFCLTTWWGPGILHTQVFDGTAWSTADPTFTGYVASLSCESPTFCLGVGGSRAYTFDGGAWSSAANLGAAANAAGASCSSSTRCVVLTQNGSAYLGTG